MTDCLESQLTEALHRRAAERTAPAPSLAELHHRARTTPGGTAAPDPGRGSRLLLVGVFAAVIVVAGFGAWSTLAGDELQSIDSAGQPGQGGDNTAELDPDDPLNWPVDDGSPEQFRRGPNGEIATFEGEVINDEVDVFLDGWFLATWDDSGATWLRPAAAAGSGIETGIGQSIGQDLTVVVESPGGLAVEACAISGQETWAFDVDRFSGLHVFADRPELVELLPRTATDIPPDAAYMADVEAALLGTGLEPGINRVLRFDSDGDGVDEVLIEATGIEEQEPTRSMLLLRKLGGDGEIETVNLYEEIMESSESNLRWVSVAAVADLNGDGTLELVTRNDYGNGTGGSIWSLDGTPTQVAEGGCDL